MIKCQVWFNNYRGNYYSYFVKAKDGEDAIYIVWEKKIESMNLTIGDYDIGVRYIIKEGH